MQPQPRLHHGSSESGSGPPLQPHMWGLASDLVQNPLDMGSRGPTLPQQQLPQPHAQHQLPMQMPAQPPFTAQPQQLQQQPPQQPQQPPFMARTPLQQPQQQQRPALPSFARLDAQSQPATLPAPATFGAGPFGLPAAAPLDQAPAEALWGQPGMPPSVKLQVPRRQGDRVTGILRDEGPVGYEPYGLVVELSQDAGGPVGALNPTTAPPPSAPPSQPGAGRGPRTAHERQLAEAGWGDAAARAGPPLPPGALPSQHMYSQAPGGRPQFDLAPVHAGPVPPEQEPDYGIVSELRDGGGGGGGAGGSAAPPSWDDPFRDFGLAAEVARRQKPAGPAGAGLRPRKRLAASGPPAHFGLKPPGVPGDPVFDGAGRPSGRDPFVLADEVARNPPPPFLPHVSPGQAAPEARVPLKVPPEGGADTLAVLGDGGPYGIVYDLGGEEAFYAQLRAQEAAAAAAAAGWDPAGGPASAVEPTEDERRRMLRDVMDWQPAGTQLVYNEETGALEAKDEGGRLGSRKARVFVEDAATGKFYRTDKPGLWKRFKKVFQRKTAMQKKREEYWEPKIKGFRRCQQVWWFHFSNFFSILGLFIQGVVGGFAIMNLYLMYIMFEAGQAGGYLQYYSALATPFARLYYPGIMFALIAVTARLCREALRGYEPRELYLRWVSVAQVTTTAAAFVATVLIVTLDDALTYEFNRNNFYWQLAKPSGWDWRLVLWNVGNILRIVFLGTSLVLFCYQYGLYVFNGLVRHETRNRIGLILEPRLIFDTSLAMYPQTPPRRRPSRSSTLPGGSPGRNDGGGGGLGIGAVSIDGMSSRESLQGPSRPGSAAAADPVGQPLKSGRRHARFADEVDTVSHVRDQVGGTDAEINAAH